MGDREMLARAPRLQCARRVDRRMTVVPAPTKFAWVRRHRLDAISDRAVQHGLRVSAIVVSHFESHIFERRLEEKRTAPPH